jgi:8-oxo-dGTP diphosphatase
LARAPIHAAGGIVFRGRKRPLVAIVQRAKDERWVLPRGKLKRKEDPLLGARREVVEETGHKVEVHEFLGAITYRTSDRPKVVEFWLMRAGERPKRDIMADILRVEWLPLKAAVRRLSFVLEKLFLAQVGRATLRRKARRRAARRKKKSQATRPRRKAGRNKTRRGKAPIKRRAAQARRRKRALRRRAR